MLENYTYTYDKADNVTAQILNGGTTSYTYDVLNQVTGSGTTTYSYGANGNRNMSGYTTGPNNQLTSDGVWNYTYDSEGNLTKKVNIATGETWTYGYDNQNHMTWALDVNNAGTTLTLATYTYDVFSQRIEKDVWTQTSGTTTVTRYGLDNGSAWADLTGSNALQTRYLRGNIVDQLFARESAGALSWYLTDWEGSVRNVTDNTGVVQDTITYDAFGNITSETNAAAGGNYKFTGRERDPETGLQYHRARYYDTSTARWTTQDPLGFLPGDPNVYRYVQNQSTMATDPTGLWKILRNRKPRAWAIPEPGDTIDKLATLIHLDAKEWPKWLKGKLDGKDLCDAPGLNENTPLGANQILGANGATGFTVPNTGYIDIFPGHNAWSGLLRTIAMAWYSQRLRVIITLSPTEAHMASHIKDPNLYKYAFIGHGGGGGTLGNETDDSALGPGFAVPAFKIAGMFLFGCGTNELAPMWSTYVSSSGMLITADGLQSLYRYRLMVYIGGQLSYIFEKDMFLGHISNWVLEALGSVLP